MRKRVMQLVLGLSPGGTERLVIELCKQLRDRIDPVVCCLDERGAWAAELEAVDIPVVAIGRQPGFHPLLSKKIASVIKQYEIDVVHFHHYTPNVYGLLASLLTNVRLVFTEHGRLSDAKPSAKRQLINPLAARLPRQPSPSPPPSLRRLPWREPVEARHNRPRDGLTPFLSHPSCHRG